MRVPTFVITVLMAGLVCPAFARVEDYGPKRYTRVGNHERHGEAGRHEVVIDRRGGPGWAGVIAGGILGAAAGLALSHAAAPVYVAPPVIGTVVPVLPGACATVPTYSGGVLYDCGNIFYQPFYEGTSLMFQIVPAP